MKLYRFRSLRGRTDFSTRHMAQDKRNSIRWDALNLGEMGSWPKRIHRFDAVIVYASGFGAIATTNAEPSYLVLIDDCDKGWA